MVDMNGSTNVSTLVEKAKADGVEFSVADGQLVFGIPKSKTHWREKLTPHREEILRLLNGEPEPPPAKRPRIERYKPFPTHKLPPPLARYVRAAAEAIGCDPAFVALPCLAVCAGLIGNARRVMIRRGWYEPAVLWTATVGESGTQKSPSLDAAVRPIEKWQAKEFERYEERRADYDVERQNYEAARKKWKTTDDPPAKPEPPTCVRYFVSDTTVEGLVPVLQENPRGVLLAREELAGWLGSFDRYAGGKSGADSAHWLSMHGARSVTVDRKTGEKRTLYVPRAAVSICGTIQPAILNRALGSQHRENGLLARLLLACPPRTPKRWTDREVDEPIEAGYVDMLGKLAGLDMHVDDDSRLQPALVRLSREAKDRFASFVDRHGEESMLVTGELAAAFSKLEGTAARLSLILALIAGETEVSDTSMENAIALVEWFKHETRRIYGMFDESNDEREQRELVEMIDRLSKPKVGITGNNLRRRSRQFETTEDAVAALNRLAKAGLGEWHTPQTNGRPTRYFRLVPESESPSNPEENGTLGYVYSTSEENTQSEWATI